MKGLRSIPRVLKINDIHGRNISLLFNNGVSKTVDIEQLLTKGHVRPELEGKILATDEVFSTVAIIDKTIGWPTVGKTMTGFSGNSEFYPYDIDPLVLYNSGTIDESKNLRIGDKVRALRKKAGLTQSELAKKAGTTKHYISKLENDKFDIELLTLKKIVEAGLNGKLSIEIELARNL